MRPDTNRNSLNPAAKAKKVRKNRIGPLYTFPRIWPNRFYRRQTYELTRPERLRAGFFRAEMILQAAHKCSLLLSKMSQCREEIGPISSCFDHAQADTAAIM